MKILFTLAILTISTTSFSQGFESLGTKKYNNVHALVVGISDYKEVHDLKYADNDANLMSKTLGVMFPSQKDNIELLTNEKATHLNIILGIRKLVTNSKEGDLIIFYFSGQGDVVDDILEGETGFFLAHDASKSRVYYPAGGGVEFNYVNKVFDFITDKGAEVWLITDACHAGSLVSHEGAVNTMATLSNGFKQTTKFISNSISELSFEDDNLKQGVFTYFLVKAFLGSADIDEPKGNMNVDEINSYLKKEVRKFTHNQQTPKVTSSNEFEDIIFINEEMSTMLNTLNKENENQGMDALRGGK